MGDLFELFVLLVHELVFNSSMHGNNLNIHQQLNNIQKIKHWWNNPVALYKYVSVL